jgi:hypothetical protein
MRCWSFESGFVEVPCPARLVCTAGSPGLGRAGYLGMGTGGSRV